MLEINCFIGVCIQLAANQCSYLNSRALHSPYLVNLLCAFILESVWLDLDSYLLGWDLGLFFYLLNHCRGVQIDNRFRFLLVVSIVMLGRLMIWVIFLAYSSICWIIGFVPFISCLARSKLFLMRQTVTLDYFHPLWDKRNFSRKGLASKFWLDWFWNYVAKHQYVR